MSRIADLIKDSISEIDERLSSEPDYDADEKTVYEILSVFEGRVEGLEAHLDTLKPRLVCDADIECDARGDLRKLKKKLRLHLATLEDRSTSEISPSIQPPSSANQSINIQNNPNIYINAESLSSSYSSSSVAISHIFEALDKCNLDGEYAHEIKEALSELDDSKSSGLETVCEKASKLLDVIKKSEEAAKPVLPFIAHALDSLLS